MTSDVDLVYLDLCDALRLLEESRPLPREVRRAFSRYVELSQRLTSVMRKDFRRRVGREWIASTFAGWTPMTELLKYLRNQDQHGEQVHITVHDRHFYNVPDDVELAGIPGRQFIVDGHWQMTDQMLDRPPQGIEVALTEPGAPRETGTLLRPSHTESSYVLHPRNSKDKLRIAAAGISDIYAIANNTFSTFTSYYEFYRSQVGT